MKLFNDLAGREWEITLTIGHIKRLNERVKSYEVDLRNPSSLLLRMEDPFFMADLLYLACKDQADERGIDSEEFGRNLAGDVFCDAKEAFTQEYIDFFPDRTARDELRQAGERARAMRVAGQAVLSKKMEELEAELIEQLTRGKILPDTPDSLASNVTSTSPGVNST